uniref:CRIB domain-containing protein n=1 Tax=Chrysemys picta bellii TaxID=8478 RepID=A0A8C3HAQ3_CHRPI
MPILKQLVSNSAHSKRRSRADLTAEMISAPLGDFRHTMHVGRAGDAFGDTSFLNSGRGKSPLACLETIPFPEENSRLYCKGETYCRFHWTWDIHLIYCPHQVIQSQVTRTRLRAPVPLVIYIFPLVFLLVSDLYW